ncbi:RecD/TraA family helicase [Chrysochromulina tobinii]|uniref:RecD/TraA family helicase n=1 Tax=Chrysochromulina tobinii TaxID=1460289 RepID=A0A0M0K0V2_9EUKA|nr:RecD/TraA family helicase [Chrysochromulina tobinii]|eukprot:KOO32232.1 RecD/TraA family helicase [Chrysochromulina sp. CCMP291]
MPRSNPNSVNNIIALLRSDAIKGIGPKLASALTTRFGERTLVVLRGAGSAQEEAALHTIPGLHVKKIANIRRTVDQWESLRKALDFGRSLGCLSEAQVSALASQHGERTEEVVRQDPYVLLELFPTLRFRDVDFLARNALQVAADASSRASAALRAGLRRALGRGHCCTPRQRLLGAAAKELQLDELPYEEASTAAERALALLVARGALVEEMPPRLGGAVRTPPPMVSFAVMQAAERHVADAVRRRIARLEGKEVLLASPTARAANVLAEAVGGAAYTIHRLLEYNPREGCFMRAANNPLQADAVVIDEASMLDVHLAGALFHALPPSTNILLVGDDDQLPSVGPGAVLHDLLRCACVPRVELSTVFRQDPSGDIARNAQLINRGCFPHHFRIFDSTAALRRAAASTTALQQRPSGCVFVSAHTEQAASEAVCGGVLDWLEAAGYDVAKEVQVLTPLKRGAAGTFALNARLQERLNPAPDRAADAALANALLNPTALAAMEQSDWYRTPGAGSGASPDAESLPRVGDAMIQLTNDYEMQVFNGDVGRVTRVWQEGKALRFAVSFAVRASVGRDSTEMVVEYTRSALGKDIALSYALTVHKAQGSEYQVVVMPILPQHALMLHRNLLYTGLSRARRLLVMVGTEGALRKAVENDSSARRITLLAERIDDKTFAPPTTRHMTD